MCPTPHHELNVDSAPIRNHRTSPPIATTPVRTASQPPPHEAKNADDFHARIAQALASAWPSTVGLKQSLHFSAHFLDLVEVEWLSTIAAAVACVPRLDKEEDMKSRSRRALR